MFSRCRGLGDALTRTAVYSSELVLVVLPVSMVVVAEDTKEGDTSVEESGVDWVDTFGILVLAFRWGIHTLDVVPTLALDVVPTLAQRELVMELLGLVATWLEGSELPKVVGLVVTNLLLLLVDW